MRTLLLSLVVTLVPIPSLQAAERMTPELLWKLGRLGSSCVDSSGTSVAYSVRHYDLEQNSGTSAIYVMDLQTGKQRQLIGNLKSAAALQFVHRPGGLSLFFEGVPADADKDAKTQVWSVDPAGGKPRQITQLESGVANLKVSPTGKHLAFTAEVKMDKTVNEIYQDLPKADARIIDSLMYRHWNAWHDYAFSHLHVAALNDDDTVGKVVDLMEGVRANCPLPPFGGAEQYNWSPDGKEIAFTAKVVNNPAESTDSDVYLVAVDGSDTVRCITHGMNGYDNDPVYSPDGKFIAFHSMQRPGFEADRNRIMLFDRASGQMRELTEGLDQTAHGARWMPDSQSLVFRSEHRGCDQLFRIFLNSQGSQQITHGLFNWAVHDVLPDGKTLLVASQNMLRPWELSALNLEDQSVTGLTGINDEIYKDLELPEVKQRWVRASDGKMIHNWVIYPPKFDASKKWPMITYCQGGPQGQIGQWFSYRWNFHLMAANDYVILAVNRRGLPGFGQAWNDQISGDWGGQAMQDILASTDELMMEPYVDTQRLAAIGASFGGYTVYWLMGNHQDRFACMIAHCGVFNLESMYGSTEELFFPTWDLGGAYWDSERVQKMYDRFSPHRFVRHWRTPLLVVHGEKDFRVPVTQGMEAFTAAQLQGVPSRFLYYPDEGHWVLGPQNGVLWHRVFFDWLGRYCK